MPMDLEPGGISHGEAVGLASIPDDVLGLKVIPAAGTICLGTPSEPAHRGRLRTTRFAARVPDLATRAIGTIGPRVKPRPPK